MKEFVTDATVAALDEVLAFVDGELEKLSCPMKVNLQIDVAVEEIFVNIASYAYAPATGKAVIKFTALEEGGAYIVFEDEGIKFDPLAKEDPDITLSAEERSIGGLGIYMVKKTMDDVTYEYKDGKNILSFKKTW